MTRPFRFARTLRVIGLAAVALVPLAFAGLYAASVGSAQSNVDHIPAAIVNSDQLVTKTAADGTVSYILAGRQLVTELTGTDSTAGFDWTITNAADAAKKLADGSVYAVLTIPSDFSSSIDSLSSSSPHRAQLAIQTDDAHSYLAGSVAQALGDGMVRTFGSQITTQYITGIYASIGDLGASLTKAADGATQLSTGAGTAASSAGTLASGLSSYTGGVSSLSSGLAQLNAGAGSLDQLSTGVASYTGGVSNLSAALKAATDAVVANPNDAAAIAQLQAVTAQLSAVAGQGSALSGQVGSAIDGIQGGIAQSAAGAAKLAANGPALASGAHQLADGIGSLSTGASTLASGLTAGAAQLPASDSSSAATAAGVAADPVGLTVSTANGIAQPVQAVATFFVPLGLWIGALAVFLVLAPVSRRALGSSAASGRLIGSRLWRAGAVTGAQALLLVVLLHTAVGIGWQFLPATIAFSLLTAAAFTAFHYLLTIGFGRAGLVISLFLLALQIAAVGGFYPVELLAAPFRAISPFLPLSWATAGMQQIVTGGDAGTAIGASLALLAFGLASVVVAGLAIRRTRRAASLGLVPGAA